MTQTVEAIYENGVLRPVQPIEGITDQTRVRLTVELDLPGPHPLDGCIGSMPDEDAAELRRIIDEEFGQVDPDEWR